MAEGSETAERAIGLFWRTFPDLDLNFYSNDDSFQSFAEEELRNSDVVIVHEWNDPQVVRTILSLKAKYGFLTLFHDTHHRAYTSPDQILRMPLRDFDGVLAFGEAIRKIYVGAFGVKRVWTFHEAADTAHFRPCSTPKETDLVWVGNWGDEERTRELEEFLIRPAACLRYRTAVHGVRYPNAALCELHQAGIEFRGYLPNLEAPRSYAHSRISLHIPRRFYANGLSGIPTIRMFEALACGTPLICSPWVDSENLFRPGKDYLCVPDGNAMTAEIHNLLKDDKARSQLAAHGLDTIYRRHTCAHRASQLIEICQELRR